jgi:putrescine transport system ATP-binding protein
MDIFLLDHFPNALHQQAGNRSNGIGMRRGLARAEDLKAEPLVRFENVTKHFGDVAAVDRLSLDIWRNEFVALLGPSGCGKTTLLRLLAGFEMPDNGRVLLDGCDLAATPPHRRPVNMMFQSYALFPHLTVAGNIGFGLRQDGVAKTAIAARVDEMLALVKLEGLGGRRPHELSGGERQRVALARSLAKRPQVLLLDEPMAALDRKLREQTQFELMDLQERLGLTFVIVTHDQGEAMTVAHRIAVMHRGRIVQAGTPAEIYEQPQSRWVAEFVGDINLIEAFVLETGPGEAVVRDKGGRRYRVAAEVAKGAKVSIALRPEKVCIQAGPAPPHDARNAMRGQVFDIAYLGGVSIYKVRLDDGAVVKVTAANVARTSGQTFGTHDEVWLSWPPDAAVVLTG